MGDIKNSTLAVIPKMFSGIEKFLVYTSPKGKAFEGNYRFVGGKIEMGEDYISTLKREFFEEFNVRISQIQFLYRKNNVLGGEIFLCQGIIN